MREHVIHPKVKVYIIHREMQGEEEVAGAAASGSSLGLRERRVGAPPPLPSSPRPIRSPMSPGMATPRTPATPASLRIEDHEDEQSISGVSGLGRKRSVMITDHQGRPLSWDNYSYPLYNSNIAWPIVPEDIFGTREGTKLESVIQDIVIGNQKPEEEEATRLWILPGTGHDIFFSLNIQYHCSPTCRVIEGRHGDLALYAREVPLCARHLISLSQIKFIIIHEDRIPCMVKLLTDPHVANVVAGMQIFCQDQVDNKRSILEKLMVISMKHTNSLYWLVVRLDLLKSDGSVVSMNTTFDITDHRVYRDHIIDWLNKFQTFIDDNA